MTTNNESFIKHLSTEGETRFFNADRGHAILRDACLSASLYDDVKEAIFFLYADVRIAPSLLRAGLRLHFVQNKEDPALVHCYVSIVETLPTQRSSNIQGYHRPQGAYPGFVPQTPRFAQIGGQMFPNVIESDVIHYGTAETYQKVNSLGAVVLIVNPTEGHRIIDFVGRQKK